MNAYGSFHASCVLGERKVITRITPFARFGCLGPQNVTRTIITGLRSSSRASALVCPPFAYFP